MTIPWCLRVLVLVLLAGSAGVGKAEDPPNIIFLLVDDQRNDTLGCAGHPIVQTPVVDSLASQGVRFENAFVTTSICAASRASILTGLHERTHRYTFGKPPVAATWMLSSYPAVLREAGYRTGFIGKYGVRTAEGPEAAMFDFYRPHGQPFWKKQPDGSVRHETELAGDRAIEFLGSQPSGKPFCLSISFNAAHADDGNKEDHFPWPKALDGMYDDVDMPLPRLADPAIFAAQPPFLQSSMNRKRYYWRWDTPEKYQKNMRAYFRMISGVDRVIGRIRQELDRLDLADQTIVIYLGDNGYYMGDRGFAGKWSHYEQSLRVPLIVYDPRLPAEDRGQVRTEMALNVDIASTVLDLAGIPSPAHYQGRSLLPLLERGAKVPDWREDFFCEHLMEHPDIPQWEGVRGARYVYARYFSQSPVYEFLHDLAEDPDQLTNLASSEAHAEILQQMQTRCESLRIPLEAPSGLMCELMSYPERTTITDPRPEFGWIVNAPTRDTLQEGYRILVAENRADLTENRGTLWDSGRRSSAQSVAVEYDGAPLSSGKSYWWKVRTLLPGGDSAWSNPQHFHTGILDDEEGADVGNRLSALLPDVVTAPANRYLPVRTQVKPVSVRKLADGHFFVDFGRAAFGTVRLRVNSPVDTEIQVHLGEEVTPEGRVNRKPGGTRRYRAIPVAIKKGKGTYTVKIPPDARNTKPNAILMPPFIGEVMPFRYGEIENSPVDIRPDHLVQMAVHYPFDDRAASFSSSDETLNQIWDLCLYTIKATSFLGIYVDGDRERIPYEADAYINQLCHYGTDREFTMGRYSHEYLMHKPTWPTEWILHSVLMAWADYQYTGDAESMERFYTDLKAKTLLSLARADGLISTVDVSPEVLKSIYHTRKIRDIVDWPAGERDGHTLPEINTVVNAFHAHALVLMSRMAAVLGHEDDAGTFAARADQVIRAFNEKLFDPERGVYIDGEGSDHAALHSSMFPLAFGLVPTDRIPAVVRHIKSRKMACSVYGAQFLMEGLYLAGEEEYALSLLRSRDERSWYNMIRQGSTIAMEAWGNQFKPNQDWNHAWGAVPANIIPRFVLGIRPIKPGFEKVLIRPMPGSLARANGLVPTIRGGIRVDIQQDPGQTFSLQVSLPANMTARVEIPLPDGIRHIWMDGQPVQVAIENGYAVVDPVGSGEHHFSVGE